MGKETEKEKKRKGAKKAGGVVEVLMGWWQVATEGWVVGSAAGVVLH